MGEHKGRKKGEGHPPPSGEKGTVVTLSEASLKVGALAWAHDDRYSRSITHDELLATLKAFQGEMKADLVLCAGTRIRLGTSTAPWTNEDPPKEIAKAIFAVAGRPVLLEWPNQPRAMWPHRWLLATGSGFEVIREGQYVFKSGPPKAEVAEVLEELRGGFGTIRLDGHGRVVTLVLVLCNEARIFDAVGNARARLRHVWTDQEIPSAFSDPWVMLHPSHKPYWSASRRSGLGQMILPAQVIHAGPFQQGHAEEELTSVCGFYGGTRTRATPSAADVEGVDPARYVELDV